MLTQLAEKDSREKRLLFNPAATVELATVLLMRLLTISRRECLELERCRLLNPLSSVLPSDAAPPGWPLLTPERGVSGSNPLVEVLSRVPEPANRSSIKRVDVIMPVVTVIPSLFDTQVPIYQCHIYSAVLKNS